MTAAPPRPSSVKAPRRSPIAYSSAGASQFPSPGGPAREEHLVHDAHGMVGRLGAQGGLRPWFGHHRARRPRPSVWPSSPPTTALADSRSIFWFVNAGPPPGKIPSICMSRFTFFPPRPDRRASRSTSLRLPTAGQVRVTTDRDDGDAVVGLLREQATVESNGIRNVVFVADGVREAPDQLVAVAVLKGVRFAPRRRRAGCRRGHTPYRSIAATATVFGTLETIPRIRILPR